MHINHEKINIIKEIITSDLCDDMGVYINKNDFERLKQQELLFKAIKRYLYDFLCAIKTTIEHTESNMIKKDDILAYFDKNQSIIPQFHDIFQKDFHHLKQYRPDIINSWKYYQKFEKMYKNIQNNNHKQK